jgi:hypothetical protein
LRHVLHHLPAEAGLTPAGLNERLALGTQELGQVLAQLRRLGLVEQTGAHWKRSPAGTLALEATAQHVTGSERRRFHFVKREAPDQPPHYLALQSTGTVWTPGESWTFDPGTLAAAAGQTLEWKLRHGFPTEVCGLDLPANPAQEDGWLHVILDCPERLAVLLLQGRPGEEADRLAAYAVQPEGWELGPPQPAFELRHGWEEAFPELRAGASSEAWREAWMVWCRQRSLPAGDAAACQISLDGHRLHVGAPARLVERLRAARSDILSGEAWVLAGEGRTRQLAQLDLAG